MGRVFYRLSGVIVFLSRKRYGIGLDTRLLEVLPSVSSKNEKQNIRQVGSFFICTVSRNEIED